MTDEEFGRQRFFDCNLRCTLIQLDGVAVTSVNKSGCKRCDKLWINFVFGQPFFPPWHKRILQHSRYLTEEKLGMRFRRTPKCLPLTMGSSSDDLVYTGIGNAKSTG
jgi:hypothetical protein